MATQLAFKKAVKHEAKGRVALIGPSGAGKSYTMLQIATLLAADGRIAAVDTEHGSLSKYANLFDFDVIEPDTFGPDVFIECLSMAEKAGAAVFCADSLSHFWMGQGGALEWVDMAKKRSSSRDDMAGWKDFSPVERRMIDAMISSPCHVIVTMRTKTEYQEQINERTGKKQRVKIGLAPVQRQGLEYEFDLIGYMDDENTFITDKTRCPDYAQKAFTKPGRKEFVAFAEWLKGEPAERRERPVPAPGPELVQAGTPEAAQSVAQRKIAEMKAKGVSDEERDRLMAEAAAAYDKAIERAKSGLKKYIGDSTDAAVLNGAYPLFWGVEKWGRVAKLDPVEIECGTDKLEAAIDEREGKSLLALWATQFDMLRDFKGEKERIGDADYYAILDKHGVKKSNEFKAPADGIKCFLEIRRHEVSK